MPIIQINSNYNFENKANHDEFISETTNKIAEIIKKPIPAIMIIYKKSEVYINSSNDTAFYIDIKYVNNDNNSLDTHNLLFDSIMDILVKFTKVDPKRIYIGITETSRENSWRYIEK